MDFEIEYAVIRLHDIARLVEEKIGTGQLSKHICDCANLLNDLNKAPE